MYPENFNTVVHAMILSYDAFGERGKNLARRFTRTVAVEMVGHPRDATSTYDWIRKEWQDDMFTLSQRTDDVEVLSKLALSMFRDAVRASGGCLTDDVVENAHRLTQLLPLQ